MIKCIPSMRIWVQVLPYVKSQAWDHATISSAEEQRPVDPQAKLANQWIFVGNTSTENKVDHGGKRPLTVISGLPMCTHTHAHMQTCTCMYNTHTHAQNVGIMHQYDCLYLLERMEIKCWGKRLKAKREERLGCRAWEIWKEKRGDEYRGRRKRYDGQAWETYRPRLGGLRRMGMNPSVADPKGPRTSESRFCMSS